MPKRPTALFVSAAFALALAAGLAGCSSTPKDEHSQQAVEKLYAEAKDDLRSGGWDRAAKTLETVTGRAAGTPLAEQALLELAYARHKNGDRAEAIAALDRFQKLHPSSPGMDYALYLRGLVNFNDNLGLFGTLAGQDLSERDQQASRDAWQALKQLVERFPQSTYAVDARQRMNYIVNALADYEVHVARYYFRRGAFVAAANRAQHAVVEFQRAPATEEALYIMARSYDRLGLESLRDDADRVLKASFPNSRFLASGLSTPQRPWWRLW